MTMSVEHRLLVVQSLLKETERDAAQIAAELILDLAKIPDIRTRLVEELDRQAEVYSGPRGKIMQGIAERIREAATHEPPQAPDPESYCGA